ncbi:MAG: MBOAT family O-acyltransferase [Bacteroidota bacterium]|jgi:alginate O-acetyltransferase complex protein AlgI
MLFSSLIFLYAFLPFSLLLTWLTPSRYQNYILLLLSLIFYAWSGVSYTLIVLFSILFNYFFGIWVEKNNGNINAKRILIGCVAGNLLLLIIIKYTPFIFQNINSLILLWGIKPFSIPDIKLIPGISFFTFHSISYVVDIYRKESPAQKNFFSMGLYIVFFPQLIAGPIIRYHEIADQFENRKISLDDIIYGINRFLTGLVKKVIFSNTFSYPADEIFKSGIQQIDTPTAWFGIICYTLHIYFDFSGYSDMAIGLGKMFGFTFPENFNFPYIARSVQDFWRRWHMTLSRWFRDYVYIPMGGNRVGVLRTYFNLIFVFFLTGFWHGASWNMIVWGLFHGFFLILERVGLEKILKRLPVINNLYTLLVVVIAWVFFRASDFEYAIQFIGRMFGIKEGLSQGSLSVLSFLNREFNLIFVIGLIMAFRIPQFFAEKINLKSYYSLSKITSSTHFVLLVVLLIVCTFYLVKQEHNPFIYFQF